jgi:hypothetical protein
MKIDLSFRKDCDYRDRATMDGDMLQIDCVGCPRCPDMGAPDCIRCISRAIADHGNPERISLRTMRDLEYSGRAVGFLNEMAALDRMASAVDPGSKGPHCRNCEHSCVRIFGIAWGSFPRPDFYAARSVLKEFTPPRPECSSCVQKTYRTLDQAELGFENVSDRASKAVNGIMGA